MIEAWVKNGFAWGEHGWVLSFGRGQKIAVFFLSFFRSNLRGLPEGRMGLGLE